MDRNVMYFALGISLFLGYWSSAAAQNHDHLNVLFIAVDDLRTELGTKI